MQAYHICHDGREGHQGASFLCTNGTLFNQHEFACDWWYNVNCADAPKLYEWVFRKTISVFANYSLTLVLIKYRLGLHRLLVQMTKNLFPKISKSLFLYVNEMSCEWAQMLGITNDKFAEYILSKTSGPTKKGFKGLLKTSLFF